MRKREGEGEGENRDCLVFVINCDWYLSRGTGILDVNYSIKAPIKAPVFVRHSLCCITKLLHTNNFQKTKCETNTRRLRQRCSCLPYGGSEVGEIVVVVLDPLAVLERVLDGCERVVAVIHPCAPELSSSTLSDNSEVIWN